MSPDRLLIRAAVGTAIVALGALAALPLPARAGETGGPAAKGTDAPHATSPATATSAPAGANGVRPSDPATLRRLVARGGYLVRGAACADCHTPLRMGPNGPEPDLARGLSGHPEGMALPPAPAAAGPWLWGGAGSNTAFWGPWGVSYSANLTPDADTGLGAWSDADFIRTMRTGKHLGVGRPVLPPMPWSATGSLSDDDLRAMLAWLKSRPAVRNRVPAPQPPALAAPKPAEPSAAGARPVSSAPLPGSPVALLRP
ncbi:c-type cytochrome [Derxia gummosa]|uniref:C-type cytochrome n=1 Tax=Derxia gummosa DSM 723 TaxID=1121388 RepID=A0A8B6X8U0_9BURK|nr:hypothetical protein [Derxia gummosa]